MPRWIQAERFSLEIVWAKKTGLMIGVVVGGPEDEDCRVILNELSLQASVTLLEKTRFQHKDHSSGSEAIALRNQMESKVSGVIVLAIGQ